MVRVEKDGIKKNIEDSLTNDYVALGWKIKSKSEKNLSEKKDFRNSRLSSDDE